MADKLPKKDAEQFGILVTCFEKKENKKGLKTAEALLKKHPRHAETMAMKGLICNNMGDKTAAHELCSKAAEIDPNSHLVWHVYGLLHKQEQRYDEAKECFRKSLALDRTNVNVSKDLSFLQIQTRELQGFVETRKLVLEQRPHTRANWVAYSAAQYLNGNYTAASDALEKGSEYTNSQEVDITGRIEDGELIMYHNQCLEKAGRIEEAIAHLESNKPKIMDKNGYKIKMAELHQLCGKSAEAKQMWYKLVKTQPDNYRFHCGLQTSILELSPELSAEMFRLTRLDLPSTALHLSASQLDILRQLYTKSNFESKVIKKIELTLYRGDEPEFPAVLDAYLRGNLTSGLPSLCHDVCSLFRKQVDSSAAPAGAAAGATADGMGETCSSVSTSRSIVLKDAADVRAHPLCIMARQMVSGYIENLRAHGHFDAAAASEGAKTINPQALLWGLYLQCHLQEKCGLFAEAMVSIGECIDHTPTALDMICKKAQLLKLQGKYTEAAETMDGCRQLDLQDRYLNNKATKYFLRANQIEQALDTISMFTKHEGDPQKNLFDLQVAWYELESADAHLRLKQWGESLRKYYAIKHHFNLHLDDLYDFHGYCVRKTTLRAYVDSIQTQDKATSHKYYQRAFRGAVGILLHLLDLPEDIDGLGYMEPALRKKEREKRKKAAKKKEQEDEKAIKAIKAAAADGDDAAAAAAAAANKKPEERAEGDIDGAAILKKDLLSEAADWCATLSSRLHLCEPDTLAMVSDVHLRRGKILLALKAVSMGLSKDRLHPALNVALMKLALKIKGPKKVPDLSKILGPVIREELSTLLLALASPEEASAPITQTNMLDIAGYVSRFVGSAQGHCSIPHSVAAITIIQLWFSSQIKPTADSAEATSFNAKMTELASDAIMWREGRNMTFKNAESALEYLSHNIPPEGALDAFRANAYETFPYSSPEVVAAAAADTAANTATAATAAKASSAADA